MAVSGAFPERALISELTAKMFLEVEAVHFNEDLVKCLFTFIVASTKTSATMSSDGIYFINENYAWRVAFRLFEEIAYSGGADTHKHFNKFRTRNREEWNASFTRNGSCQ